VIYRLCGVDPTQQMGWQKYATALLVFNSLGALVLYALQRSQLAGTGTYRRTPYALGRVTWLN
jgi:K+-transporting ATPase A subunit